jgi:hypothetical protein
MNALRPYRHLLALALAVAPIGCSRGLDDLPREPVAGTVTMDGQALPEAVIVFSPTGDASKGPAAAVVAEVKDGQFAIPRDEGPIPGSYKISISHAEMKDADSKSKGRKKTPILSRSKVIGPELIPARYNTQTELTADIPKGGRKDLKFDLKSK